MTEQSVDEITYSSQDLVAESSYMTYRILDRLIDFGLFGSRHRKLGSGHPRRFTEYERVVVLAVDEWAMHMQALSGQPPSTERAVEFGHIVMGNMDLAQKILDQTVRLRHDFGFWNEPIGPAVR